MEIELNKVHNQYNIIDIRENYLYSLGHIPNSINIPYNELIKGYGMILNPTKTYYIYCSKGKKSKTLCDILNKLGYKCYSIIDGYDNYYKKTI